ncbi:GtrA family protein [Pseudoduganella chitinolytica]|uniref:GtrA family protein n=1 Tax=Pseudoduganella chitinolytica TaxID=34070 RepID=A0ABY8BAJ1_9BURK|nr:GtrA family protein [Pseudoduganella chitinolytica]WEF32926.1 GtrA family protein [Pseudoduganella chitinolytica]
MNAVAIKRQLAQHRALLVFALIGALNTLLHSGTVVALVEGLRAHPVAANVAGFALANTFSYFANCHLAFRQPPSWQRYRKFLAVSMVSLLLTVLLSTLAEALHWHYLAGLALVLVCGPVLTFFLHKTVTFRTST